MQKVLVVTASLAGMLTAAAFATGGPAGKTASPASPAVPSVTSAPSCEPHTDSTKETGTAPGVSYSEAVPAAAPQCPASVAPGSKAAAQAVSLDVEKPHSDYFASEGMVVPLDWKADGYVVGEKDRKILISAGDTVYIDLGQEDVKPGTQCMLYRRIRDVKNPYREGNETLGFEIRRIARIEVTGDVGEKVSSAKVLVSYEPVEKGDFVKILP